MFQLLGGRAAVSPVVYDLVQWDSSFQPPEYAFSQSNKAYARSGSDPANNALRNFVFTNKRMDVQSVGGKLGYYWEIDLTGSATMDGYIGVMDADTAELDYDADLDPLSDSVVYRGDGSTWVDGVEEQTGFATYGNGKTLMMAFDPLDGALWTGVDGVWDREPWIDNPAGYAPNAGFSGSFVIVAQAKAAIDAGVLKAGPDDFTYPIPEGFLPLADNNANPPLRPQYWRRLVGASLVYSVPYDRSSTFISLDSDTNFEVLGSRAIGGASGAGVPAAGYYCEIRMSPGVVLSRNSVGFLPRDQWAAFPSRPRALQWWGTGVLDYAGAWTSPSPPAWNNDPVNGVRLMLCFNPHTGSLWLGQDGVWVDDPEVDPPTFSYSDGLTREWSVCAVHGAYDVPSVEKGGTIYALPSELQYPLPSNAIPLAQYV